MMMKTREARLSLFAGGKLNNRGAVELRIELLEFG